MSDAKTKTRPADAEVQQQDTPAAPAATQAQPLARDAHTGKGGHYEIRNGQRVLVQRTKPKE